MSPTQQPTGKLIVHLQDEDGNAVESVDEVTGWDVKRPYLVLYRTGGEVLLVRHPERVEMEPQP